MLVQSAIVELRTFSSVTLLTISYEHVKLVPVAVKVNGIPELDSFSPTGSDNETETGTGCGIEE